MLSSKPPVPFDIYFFTLKLKNSYKMAFFLQLYRGDFLGYFGLFSRSTSYIIVQTSTFKFPRFCKVHEVPSIEIRAKVNKLSSCLRVLATRTKLARKYCARMVTSLKTVLYVSFMSKLKLPIIHN